MTGKAWIYIYNIYIYIYIYLCVCVCEEIKHEISGTAIGTKFAPTYASIFMDEIETNSLDTQEFKLLVWFQYIDDVFFIWTHGKKNRKSSWKDFNNYHPNIEFTHVFNKLSIPFLDLKVSFSGGQLTWTFSLQTNIRTCTIHQLIQIIPNVPLFLVKLWWLAGHAIIKQILKDIWAIWNHGSKQEAIINI